MAAAEDEKTAATGADDEIPDDGTGYKVAAKVDMDTLMKKDADDEALQKYKMSLVGDPAEKIIDDSDPRQVFFDKLVIIPTDTTISQIELDPSKLTKDTVAFTLKQGESYRIKIVFRVQREIVMGLKKYDKISRKGIPMPSQTEMIGGFAPSRTKVNEFTLPEATAPSGMMARGTYSAKTQFIDDDKVVHLEFSYKFNIAKEWDATPDASS